MNYAKKKILKTDASDMGAGRYLYQESGHGIELSVAFGSISFNSVHQRWSTYEQETFAIYFSIVKLQHFKKGARFVVKTDHRNLKYIVHHRTPSRSRQPSYRRFITRATRTGHRASYSAGRSSCDFWWCQRHTTSHCRGLNICWWARPDTWCMQEGL